MGIPPAPVPRAPMLPALSLVLVSFLPQGPGSAPEIPESFRAVLGFSNTPSLERFAPFLDAQQKPARTKIEAAGTADFDGDGQLDAWFLAGAGPRDSALSVQMARASSLQRFRPWHLYPPGGWVAAATYHSKAFAADRVLLADPLTPDLVAAQYVYPVGFPRQGSFQTTSMGFRTGDHVYEIRTRDDDGDGHDDIAVLRNMGPGRTRLELLHMGIKLGALQPLSVITLDLPLHLSNLRMLDRNGDGHSDVAVMAPGLGLLLLQNDGKGSLRLAGFTALPSGLRDLVVADQDGDGRDDVLLVFDDGLALCRSTPAGPVPSVHLRPPSVGAFKTAAVLDANSDGRADLLAVAANGRSLVIYPGLPGHRFGSPLTQNPELPQEYPGPGTKGIAAFTADLDHDGDLDLLLQMPSGDHWIGLLNPAVSFVPFALTVKDEGSLGETGFRKQLLTLRVPDAVMKAGLKNLEVAVFLEDPRNRDHSLYWGRMLPKIDPGNRTASFRIYFQQNKAKLASMVAQHRPNLFADGVTAGGDALLSIHAKSGTIRFASMLVHHKGGGDGSKSGKGVVWTVRPAPPKPSSDEELLPWN